MLRSNHLLIVFFVTIIVGTATAQKNYNQIADQQAKASFDNFKALLSIPNDAHFPADLYKNMEWCEKAFGDRGFTLSRLETETVPLLLAVREARNASKTILIYLQIDGQPVDSSKWFQESPWIPALKRKIDGEWKEIPWDKLSRDYQPDDRIFARAASDAKGPAAMFLAALDAAEEAGVKPNYNIKVIMDFEEELGSPQIPAAVGKYREQLAADALIIYDGPMHLSNEPTLVFGARGIATMKLIVYGPRVAQHSGHYGNYVPNPAIRLSKLIASMKNEDGKVAIPGWYDGISFDESVRNELESVPDDENMMKKRLGIAQPESVGKTYQEALQYPSLNVRGMASGWVDEKVRTIIPPTATAEIDIRLVKESDPDRLIKMVKDHISSKGYYVTSGEPTDKERAENDKIISIQSEVSYQAFRTSLTSDVGIWLNKAIKRAHGKDAIKIRTAGGSIPISPFVITLGIPAVSVPTVNRDNNQHSPNENIRVGNYVDGVKIMLSILQEKF